MNRVFRKTLHEGIDERSFVESCFGWGYRSGCLDCVVRRVSGAREGEK
jgi:hypothetical protein